MIRVVTFLFLGSLIALLICMIVLSISAVLEQYMDDSWRWGTRDGKNDMKE